MVVLRIVFLYAGCGGLWILLSDKALAWFIPDPELLALASILKGWGFVAVTALGLYFLLQRWTTRAASAPLAAPLAPLSRELMGLPFLLLASVFVALTVAAIGTTFRDQRAKEVACLQAIVHLRAAQIADWLGRLQAAAELVQISPSIAEEYRRGWAGGAASAREIPRRLADYLHNGDFSAVTVLDPAGHLLWSTPEAPHELPPDLRAGLERAARERRLQRVGPFLGADGLIHLHFAIPIKEIEPPPLLVLHLDPGEWLAGVLHTWPVPSASGESLLFRREGNRVLFLSELRHRADSALRLNLPIAHSSLLAGQVLRGAVQPGTPIDGRDYRGVPALGVAEPIPGTDWFLLSKIDRAEIWAPAIRQSLWIGLSGLLGLFMSAATLFLVRQRQQLQLAVGVQQAQAERLRALTLLDAIAAGSEDAIVAKDLEGRYLLFNPAAGRFVGQPPERVLGQDDRALFPPEQVERLRAAHCLAIAENRIVCQEEVLDTPDGSRVFLSTKGPLRDPEGRVIGTFAVSRDITERKRIEDQLELHRRHLEALVSERTAELEQARAQAEAANRAKSAFLANMSHEIRTPMNAVLGFCYLLQQRSMEEEARDLVRKVQNSGRLLLALINDILDLSKIEAERLEIERLPFRLSQLMEDLAAIMAASASNKDVELIVTAPPGIDGLIGDALRLQQVLVNLLSNAIKFTERGEVELRVVVVSAHEREVSLLFSVRDTGIGISPAQQAEIFSAFSQGDLSTSRRFGGTGLGLAISQRLVRLMGGTLSVESELGQGSEFRFVLPLQRDTRMEPAQGELAHVDLLVADDCATARNSLEQTARILGWTAELVDSGQAALARTLERLNGGELYDAYLLDWKMPEQDGLTTAMAIRAAFRERHAHRRPPILIMVTAYSRDELLAEPGIGEVDWVLAKPVTPSALYNAIAGILRRREAPGAPAQAETTDAAPRRLPGMRVLVVDDSDVNRELAQFILEGEGAIVHLADDGQAAVDWLEAHPESVDIVLMDVQMPGVDGYAATRRIREDARWKDLPIVALTAGAFQTLRDAALEAGMNDFISKPFDVGQMVASIRHWTGCRDGSQPQGMAASAENEKAPAGSGFDAVAEASFSTPPALDWSGGLRHWGKAAIYRTYLNKFVAEYAGAGDLAAAHCRQGDLSAAAALAHKLKGVASTLALPRVAALAHRLDAQLKASGSGWETVAELQAALDEACRAIALRLGPEPPEPAPEPLPRPSTREELASLGSQLLGALDRNDPGAAESALAGLRERAPSARWSEIQACLTDFDFRSAEQLASALVRDLSLSIRE